jgi:hypothetical protein
MYCTHISNQGKYPPTANKPPQLNAAVSNYEELKMWSFNRKSISFVIALMASSGFAAPKPLDLGHEVHLSEKSGRPYLNTVKATRGGIKSHFDADFVQTYQVAGWTKVKAAYQNFDKKIQKTVLSAFEDGEDGLKNLVISLQGSEFSPDSMVTLLRQHYHGRGNIFALAHFLSMASGAGTLVTIDEENYFYNFGYRDGSLADDVKSGRSYGAGPLHAANDASDIFYLNELEDALKTDEGVEDFYRSFLKILTSTDVSGYETLSPKFQTVETDLLAIYTAELDRHLMVNLDPAKHPWENDLAEATFVSIFNAEIGKMYKDGQFVIAPLKDHWSKSDVSNRSGIGITRKDRRSLQKIVSTYLREHASKTVVALEKIIGTRKDGDLFRGLMEFLNNNDNQSAVTMNAQKIEDLTVKLLMQMKTEAAEIEQSI